MLQIVGWGRPEGGPEGRVKLSFQCLRPFGPQTIIGLGIKNELFFSQC
jgi:hypothetical protein